MTSRIELKLNTEGLPELVTVAPRPTAVRSAVVPDNRGWLLASSGGGAITWAVAINQIGGPGSGSRGGGVPGF